ncbi:MAG: pilus assembly protein, partial [Pseudomonadota bacterium]|nr:pilus assembly protein [Pseudomonadota bacterium]
KRFVMVGTGRLLDTTDVLSAQQQSFYAIVDGTNARFNASTDLPAGINFPITRSNLISGVNGTTFDPASKIGWYIDLGNAATGARAGYRVLLDATTLAGTVAFAATLPGGDVCNPSGTTNFYALDYGSTVSAFKNTDGTSLLYVTKNGTGTDLRFTSVSGTAELLYGIDLPGIGALAISPLQPQSVRRLNWRELQTVE